MATDYKPILTKVRELQTKVEGLLSLVDEADSGVFISSNITDRPFSKGDRNIFVNKFNASTGEIRAIMDVLIDLPLEL